MQAEEELKSIFSKGGQENNLTFDGDFELQIPRIARF